MPFLKLLRRRPVSDTGDPKKDVKDIATFINRELLPFLQEFKDNVDTEDSSTDSDLEDIIDDITELKDQPFVTSAASSVLTNEKVATTSTEIQVSPTASAITWALNTASVVFAKLQNLAGLSVLGRATNSSGVMAAITATAGYQALHTNEAGTAVLWESYLPTVHLPASLSGTHSPYLLPVGFRHGDTIRLTITGDTVFRGIAMSDGSQPVEGMEFNLTLSDQSGGSAPGWTLDLIDLFNGGGAPNGQFRTPGQVQGTSPNPNPYRMQSEEEGCRLAMQSLLWRVFGGTAAQAVTGDITIAAGNGSTRDSQITAGVIVNADINASAAIALSKLATQNANTVVANATAGAAVPTAVAVGTNTVVGRVAGNIVAAALVDAQVAAAAAIALSKLATQAADSFVGNFTNGVAVPTARAGSSIAGTGLTYTTGGTLSVSVPLTDADKGDITVGSSGTTFTIDNGVVTPAKTAVIASNIAVPFTIFISATSGGAIGTADDVTIYNANAPFAFRITNVRPIISTAVALSTVELRDTAGGAGAALSSSFTSATAGEAAIAASWTATSTVAANGSVFLRRSDRSVVLQLIIECIRT